MKKKTRFLPVLLLFTTLSMAACGTGAGVASTGENSVSEEKNDAESAQAGNDVAEPGEVKNDAESGSPAAGQREYDNITGKIAPFRTTDLDGNTVTEEIFADKDITMVNIWGTYCGPCINEMPTLGEMAADLPSNAQIIGIVCDVYSGGDTSGAKKIVDETGADYLHLTYSEDLRDFMSEVYAVPTTYFVDSEGEIIGEPVVGALVREYAARLEEYAD